MTDYRNITVNINQPYRKVDFTAVSILAALAGGPVLSSDLDAAIAAYPGASLSLRANAIKGLRNVGFEIVCENHREHSEWWIEPTTGEMSQYHDDVVRKSYSRLVTMARQFARTLHRMPGDMTVVAVRNRTVQSAIDFGVHPAMGKTLQEVVDDCDPLVVATVSVP